MPKHNRREGYWKYYESARAREPKFVKETLVELIRENPVPRKRSNRGHPLIHSKEKMDFACLWLITENGTFREIECEMESMRDVYDEPNPDHSWLCRHMQTIPTDWMDFILAETARRCLKEVEKSTDPVAADSSGVETTRYEDVVVPDKAAQNFCEKPKKIYKKYHITAILGLQIVLSAITTSSNVHDTVMLPVMLKKISQSGINMMGRIFNADRGYDSDENCKEVLQMQMLPNIKQRKDATNRGKPYRKKAAELFDENEYKKRALIEGIFGAEEARGHQLHCRFILEENHERFSKGRAIAWNIRVLNRFIRANELKIPLPSYGDLAKVACT